MRRTTLTADSTDYSLDPATDVDALKARMVEAVRDGGDFVTFTTAGADEVNLLVSTGSRVAFRTAVVQDADPADAHASAAPRVSPFLDDLDWLEHGN